MKKLSEKSKKKIKKFFQCIWENIVLFIILFLLFATAVVPNFLIFQAIANSDILWW